MTTVESAPWAPTTQQVRLGGLDIRVAVVGEGPPLLLINGIGGNIEMWGALVRRLPGRRLVMFDAPGTGGSPPLRRPVRMAGYVTLVTDLLDHLGIDRTDVLGYSWGGALAQELAYRAPGRVRRLVLCATVPGLGGQPPAPWVIGLMATPARYYSETYLKLVSPLVFGPRPGPDADTGHSTARRERPPTMRGYSQQLFAISGWSSRRFLHRISAPTLVLTGDKDPLVPARNARILARGLRDSRLHVLPGGHLFLLERPDQGIRLVEDFLTARRP